jgi:hypothetical protein
MHNGTPHTSILGQTNGPKSHTRVPAIINKFVLFIDRCRHNFNSLFTIQPSFQHYVTCAIKSTITYNIDTRNKPCSMALNNARQHTKLIHLYSYNKSQRDALFLKFVLIKYSAHFGQICCPSSGVSTLHTQQQVFVMLVL